MSTSIIEPGTRLSGRYRLEERVGRSGGSTLWKAIDEILARAVAVRTFDPDFPRVGEVVTAARAASRLTDPRLTQVFDADDSGEQAYVVSEWAAGQSLEAMLKRAPLEPGRATTLLYEAAEAIAAAHAAGLSHLRLRPRHLLWTTGGTVKLLGVAVDAVLADVRSDDPALEDTRALGRMLYAAVTARWPGDPADCDLPPAPQVDGVYKAARQVQAGVSAALDSIICRAMGLPLPNGQQPINTPAELAAALKSVPRTPLPLFAGPAVSSSSRPRPAATTRPEQVVPQRSPQRPASRPARPASSAARPRPRPAAGYPPSAPSAPAASPPPSRRSAAGDGGGLNRTLLAIAAAAVTVIVGVGVWALTNGGGDQGGPNSGGGTPSADAQRTPAARKLEIHSARGLYEERQPGHPDATVGKTARLVHDGKKSTIWESQTYATPAFGNFLNGVGVMLDLGSPVGVERIELTVPDAGAGATLEIRVGDQDVRQQMRRIDERTTNSGTIEVRPGQVVRGRYVLLWISKLPVSNKAQISEVVVYGHPG
ncbi:protein kinase family protein [Thermomonospora catenispora]|uniref:protein kinase family protein n=1 Tax=Thermomonospora catenispora TaxID=2493090 RepID=UPI001123BC7D|nr:protein kinase family protein [Thermomonospora catenispora]TNY37716.1 AMP-binding protein [Thermomonospora catenispora]